LLRQEEAVVKLLKYAGFGSEWDTLYVRKDRTILWAQLLSIFISKEPN